MESGSKVVEIELLPWIRVYKDGSVERLTGSPFVPPSPQDPQTGVSSKDITISQNPPISARIYLPRLPHHPNKLPILLYFHGGGFCAESAFSFLCHRQITTLVSQAQILAVSVEYRLAPEHTLPAAYDDCWAALQWLASHSNTEISSSLEPWLTDRGDFKRLFIGGDSAGGNIAHNIAMRAGCETLNGGVRILGALLVHPYFWGSEPIGSEYTTEREQGLAWRLWKLVNPQAGIDDPTINPICPGAPSLAGLGCSRLLVCAAGMDRLRDRSVAYGDAVRESGWKGEVEVFEVDGEPHVFHIHNHEGENGKKMFERMASFLK